MKHYFRALEVASGAILMGVGVMLMTDQFTVLNRRFQFLADWLTTAEQILQ